MSSPWVLPGAFVILLMILCGMAYLVRAGIRTLNLTECRRCGASKVRHSRTRSSDMVAGMFLLRPYRCGGCLKRFYAFRTFPAALPVTPVTPGAVALAVPEAAPILAPARKSPLRIRVKVIVRLPWPTDWQSAWDLLLAEEQGFVAMPRNHRSSQSG